MFRAAMREAKPLARAIKPPRPGPLAVGEKDSDRARKSTLAPTAGESPRQFPGEGVFAKANSPAPNPGIDRRTEERLRRGDIAIDATLDLHGMTQHAAHRALDRFVRQAWTDARRMLLVITGKGSVREGGGVLRRELPRWLSTGENAARVLKIAAAQPRHGGGGAYYVLLRRQREP